MKYFVNSTFLDHVFSSIRNLDGSKDNEVTAEKLLKQAVLMANNRGIVDEYRTEVLPYLDLMVKNNLNSFLVSSELSSYIASHNYDDSDKYYMEKYKEAALKEAESTCVGEKVVVRLNNWLNAIFSYPTPTIGRILRYDEMLDESMAIRQDAEDFFGDSWVFVDIPEKCTSTKSVQDTNDDPFSARKSATALVKKVKSIQDMLLQTVFGQDRAISIFASGYFKGELAKLTKTNRNLPKAVFLFAGPPGVGKTMLAENAAELLDMPFKRFDMSEYVGNESVYKFCGFDRTYNNARPGDVTEFVHDNPECIILFDEIEKAGRPVVNLLLQLLDGGRLKDNYYDDEISFSMVTIILTTNAGRQLYEDNDNIELSTLPRKVIIDALKKDVNPFNGEPYFPPAICSRFAAGNIAMFNNISSDGLCRIAEREFNRYADSFYESFNINISADKNVFAAILFAEGASADARTVSGRADSFFGDELFELMRMIESQKAQYKFNDVRHINICTELPENNSEIRSLFEKTEKDKVLIFGDQKALTLCSRSCRTCDFLHAEDIQSAEKLLNSHEISYIIAQAEYGVEEGYSCLNIEDAPSLTRDFLKFIHENYYDMKIFILTLYDNRLTNEEQITYRQQGIKGVFNLPEERKGDFASVQKIISGNLYRQRSMERLARSQKVISFSTSQQIEGVSAEIKLFDFRISTAVNAEDSENIISTSSRPDVKFDDIIGAEDAKTELRYFAEYLKNPKKYLAAGVSAPKGALLYGPPGTGKTMLAKAMAGESEATFIAAEGNQFLKKYVGEGPEAIHKLFQTARKYAPSIVFIDEIETIAQKRDSSSDMTQYRAEVLTALLTEMDGFRRDLTRPVIVIAATNYDGEGGNMSIDPAVGRRFDRRIYVDLPNRKERYEFMKRKISGKRIFEINKAFLENIAVRSTGMSLAQLDSVFELAMRMAIRDGNFKVTKEILDEAFESFNGGEIKKWDSSGLERVARHESGHALISWLNGDTPAYVTVVPRGNHSGYVQHSDNEDKPVYTRAEILGRIRCALGGRAAELVYYGNEDGLSTSVSSDLKTATVLAEKMLCEYGMDESFGTAAFDTGHTGGLSEKIRVSINKILAEETEKAVKSITRYRNAIDAATKALIEKNHLTGGEISEIFALVLATS